ncbi:MAG: hypothetical protein HOK67_12215 [Deltaproteobacteria bacterium]|jgi:hypothetical protein|nr:hypothetical protein [Deltaproteobacteria bacterium]MBT4643617.1 hypothetical protein [Deltaproteobacteria bacterium]MBT6500658.1 hypothetical protein [Deltaproteobacteria bacterium]MBT6615728.1 hypothetical protein [Deltaproteobacteria bacterium]MBT7711160.1 hypothetical protein [Deltaproteobacteria bacterium]
MKIVKNLSYCLMVLPLIALFCFSSLNFVAAEEGVTKDTIKIGSIIGLSGPRGAGIVGRYMDRLSAYHRY